MDRDIHYLLGGSGQPNLGDEWVISAWLDHLAPVAGPVLVDCISASQSTFLHGIDRPGVKFVTLIKDLCWAKSDIAFADQLRRGLHFLDPQGERTKFPHLDFIWDRFRRVRTFHIYGGGYLNVVWPNHAFYLGIAAALKRRYGFALYATGQGLVPFAELHGADDALLRGILAEFDLFETRDAPSHQALAPYMDGRANLRGCDDTFLQPVRRAARPADGMRVFHISGYDGPQGARMRDAIARTLPALRGAFGRFLFWECDPAGDRSFYRTLLPVLPELELCACQDLLDRGLPVAAGDYLLTVRFHPHLLAARLGGCGMFIHDSIYYDVKHTSVTGLGSGFQLFSEAGFAESLHTAPAANALEAAQSDIMADKAALAGRIYGDVIAGGGTGARGRERQAGG